MVALKKSGVPQISPVTVTPAALAEAFLMQNRLLVLQLTVGLQWLVETRIDLLVRLVWVCSQLSKKVGHEIERGILAPLVSLLLSCVSRSYCQFQEPKWPNWFEMEVWRLF